MAWKAAFWAATGPDLAILAPGGNLIVKATKGGLEDDLKREMQRSFKQVTAPSDYASLTKHQSSPRSVGEICQTHGFQVAHACID